MRSSGWVGARRSLRRTGTVFVAVGVGVAALFVLTTAVLALTLGPVRGWPTAPGVVTGNAVVTRTVTDTDGPDRTSYERTTHYREIGYTVDGQSHTLRGRTGRDRPWPLGETVVVAYDPTDPSRAEVEGTTWTVLWITGLSGAGLGTLFAAIGLAVRAVDRRR